MTTPEQSDAQVQTPLEKVLSEITEKQQLGTDNEMLKQALEESDKSVAALQSEVERLRAELAEAKEALIKSLHSGNTTIYNQVNKIAELNSICDSLREQAKEQREAMSKLIDAPHQEHFAARLNEQEMEGIDAIKLVLEKYETKTP